MRAWEVFERPSHVTRLDNATARALKKSRVIATERTLLSDSADCATHFAVDSELAGFLSAASVVNCGSARLMSFRGPLFARRDFCRLDPA